MEESVFFSFVSVAVFILAYVFSRYVVKVTSLTKILTGSVLVVLLFGYIVVLSGLEGSTYILDQLSSLSDFPVLSDYGYYIFIFLFYVSFLNSVGVGKK